MDQLDDRVLGWPDQENPFTVHPTRKAHLLGYSAATVSTLVGVLVAARFGINLAYDGIELARSSKEGLGEQLYNIALYGLLAIDTIATLVGGILASYGGGYLFTKESVMRNTQYTITDTEIVMKKRGETEQHMPYTDIKTVSISRGMKGLLTDSGDVVITTKEGRKHYLASVNNPERVRETILRYVK